MVMKHIARLILKIFGWKLKGGLPEDKKAVVISVPHTSIMDFIWGKLTFISQGVPTYILMKKEFFFFPLGPILKALNVIPVDRGNKENHIVERMVEEFKKRDVMYLTITPEGSRKKRKSRKSRKSQKSRKSRNAINSMNSSKLPQSKKPYFMMTRTLLSWQRISPMNTAE